jgi:hypothetical protein
MSRSLNPLLTAAALLVFTGGTVAAGPSIAVSDQPGLGPQAEEPVAPVNDRDRLALIFIGYTSAKLCADAGHGFSAAEIALIATEVTRASKASGFTQDEQEALWIDVLTSMGGSKGAPTAENCAEDRAMLRFQMPTVFSPPQPGGQNGL